MKFRESTITLPHGSIAVVELGAKEAKHTFLFLHGWQDNAGSFFSTMQAFWQKNQDCRLIAIDWFGHGLSDHKSGDNFYHFFDYIDDLHLIISELHLSKVHLVGHSLGGIVAAVYSATFPNRIASLMLIEALFPLTEEPNRIIKRLRNGIHSRQHYRSKSKREIKNRHSALALRSKINILPTALLEPIIDRGIHSTEQTVEWNVDEKVKCDSLYRLSEAHVITILSNIMCPTMMILGNNGYEELKRNQHYYAYIKQFEYDQITGGHHCHLENPTYVADYLIRLLNKY